MHLNAENASELFEACRGKTRRQVAELLAVRFPRPDVREQIRRLPVRPRVPIKDLAQTLSRSPASDSRLPTANPGMAKIIPNLAPKPAPKPFAASTVAEVRQRARELEPLSADRFGVHFMADPELRELIERTRAGSRESSASKRRSGEFSETDGGQLRTSGREATLRHRREVTSDQAEHEASALPRAASSTRWSGRVSRIRPRGTPRKVRCVRRCPHPLALPRPQSPARPKLLWGTPSRRENRHQKTSRGCAYGTFSLCLGALAAPLRAGRRCSSRCFQVRHRRSNHTIAARHERQGAEVRRRRLGRARRGA